MPKTSKHVKEDISGWSISRRHEGHENTNRSEESDSDLSGHSLCWRRRGIQVDAFGNYRIS